jgi:alpha(1,3/1,4) fucosyltransferase
MSPIRIDFCDFWSGFPKEDNFFVRLLRTRFEIEVAEDPDFLFYAEFGHQHRLFPCPRIFFSGESSRPNFRECDYALTCHDLDDPRHLRLPLYVLYTSPERLLKTQDEPEHLLATRTKFCSLVISNPRPSERTDFFHRLSRYRTVDSGGSALNNLGHRIGATHAEKLEFLQPYKFNIAFENRSLSGYTTEKLVDAMLARCLPIYWGNPQVAREFNPKSFLNALDYPSQDALVQRIIQIDQDDALYLDYLRQPYFHQNQPNEFFAANRLLDFFQKIFTTRIQPVGARRSFFQLGRWILVKKKRAAER